MLRQVTLKNFKLFDDEGITIAPGKITVLIGANGTGKSSVLQALLLLKESVRQGFLVFNGELIDIGTFRDIVHNQDVKRLLEIGISAPFHNLTMLENSEPPVPSSGYISSHAVFTNGGFLVEQTGTIGSENGVQITCRWHPELPYAAQQQIIIKGIGTFHLTCTSDIGYPIRIQSVNIQDTDKAPAVQNELNNSLLPTLTRLLRNFYLIPAIRGFDSLTYETFPGELTGDLTAAGGPDRQAMFAANLIASKPELADEVAERLNAILQVASGLRHRVVQGRIRAETARGRRSTNLVNEAFGLNQLVAPLLWLSQAPRGSIVGIEEPEIHLHPRAQAALCDVFVDFATREQKQLILTTHSEHILMGLLTAVANGQLQPDDLAVYEFHRQEDTARAERLSVNEYGQIEGGLRGFLEADIDEIGELIKARFR